MNIYAKELELAKSIAKEAGVIILKYFDGDQSIEIKEDASPVTIADKMVNSLVIKRLAEVFPEDGVVGEEESTSTYGMGRKWICDPIDGTQAYTLGIPSAMFSLAFVVDGKPVVGVAYDAFLDKMYTGQIGEKSFCNDAAISVSNLDCASGLVVVSSKVVKVSKMPYFQKMAADNINLISFTSGMVYKCCLIARGKFVGYVDPGVSPHDIAAIHSIVVGAGGTVTALDGTELDYSKPFKGALISNAIAHNELLKYCA